MQELFDTAIRWVEAGKSVALAIVVKTWGSSPRAVGAKMIINSDGEMAGSVSGGCVEGAVVEIGMQVLQTGIPQRLQYGVTDETAWDVGLACGGEIEILVKPLNLETFNFGYQKWAAGKKTATCIVIRGPEESLGVEYSLAEDNTFICDTAHSQINALADLAKNALESGSPQREVLPGTASIPIEVFVDILLPPPTLVIVGGVHIAIPLVMLANTLGFRTIVIEPRRKFGSENRFPHAAQLINAWPAEAFSKINLNSSTAVAMLTHDAKIDDPALAIALPSAAFYVGALGSQKTQSQRRQRLLEMGLKNEDVERIYGPIGLNLGGRSPEEIALAIMAEIVQAQNA